MAQPGDAGQPATSAEHHDEARAKVPSTSIVTCWMRALESRKPESSRLIFDPFAERLCGSGAHAQRLLDESLMKTSNQVDFWLDMMASRTRWLDDAIVAAKPTQLVIVGSGLDSRAWRMNALSLAEIFELDFPEVLHAKATLLDAENPVGCWHAVPANLGKDDWLSSLALAGFHHGHATVWLLEGLTGYLTPQELDALFGKITAASAAGSSILATFTGLGSGQETNMHKTSWNSTREVETFLANYGWAADAQRIQDIAAGYGRAKHIPESWEYYFCKASRAQAACRGC
eukprot:TRINITY_DN59789_c0_g1_i1.p1 TRINITY_DN59789_c0_g1~~TRINITY_DN59789_c0_g1_i1.p1  ORF type:complete len:288 (-),score=57.86 TRINITY_DN59789_c0_g1_i1:299-1162(-)